MTDDFHKAHVHHIKPNRYGGQGDEPNLAILCGMCHKRIHSFYEQTAMWDALARDPDFFKTAYSKFIREAHGKKENQEKEEII